MAATAVRSTGQREMGVEPKPFQAKPIVGDDLPQPNWLDFQRMQNGWNQPLATAPA